MQCRSVGDLKALEEPSNAHLFDSVHKYLLFYWLPNASAAKMSPFWCVVSWNENNCFFSNSPHFNYLFHTWFVKCDISELLVMSHLLGTLWMCLLSSPVFTSSCGQKAMRVANYHICWVFQDFLHYWWFNCIVYAQLIVLFSPPLVLTRAVCLFCFISPRKCLKPQTWKSRNAMSTWTNEILFYVNLCLEVDWCWC